MIVFMNNEGNWNSEEEELASMHQGQSDTY
jgi:hypothetical protein